MFKFFVENSATSHDSLSLVLDGTPPGFWEEYPFTGKCRIGLGDSGAGGGMSGGGTQPREIRYRVNLANACTVPSLDVR
jgi:hypothetical protein